MLLFIAAQTPGNNNLLAIQLWRICDIYEPGNAIYKTRYPITGWGTGFSATFYLNRFYAFLHIFDADSIIVSDSALEPHTRTFFRKKMAFRFYQSALGRCSDDAIRHTMLPKKNPERM
jgi:hypothetical protein